MNITYGPFSYIEHDMRVFLDGKAVGSIIQLHDGMWQYWPKGSRAEGGDKYATLALCKRSLEGDDNAN